MDHNDLSKETKLSQAIELTVTSGVYQQSSCYMCIALKRMDMEQHIGAVHEMVFNIHKDETRYRDLPLACALDDAGIYIMEEHSWEDRDLFTTQLYCWWVFDLKRKGL